MALVRVDAEGFPPREDLRATAPTLSQVATGPSVKVVGFRLELQGTAEEWEASLAKWEAAVGRIGARGMPVTLSAHFDHDHALSPLSGSLHV